MRREMNARIKDMRAEVAAMVCDCEKGLLRESNGVERMMCAADCKVALLDLEVANMSIDMELEYRHRPLDVVVLQHHTKIIDVPEEIVLVAI